MQGIKDTINEDSENKLVEFTLRGENVLKSTIDSFLNSLELFALTISQKENLMNENNFLSAKIIAEENQFSKIVIIDYNGIGIDSDNNDVNMSNYPFIKDTISSKQNNVSNVISENGKDYLVFNVPVIKDDVIIGCVSAYRETSTFKLIFNSLFYENDISSFIYDNNGNIIVLTDFNSDGLVLSDIIYSQKYHSSDAKTITYRSENRPDINTFYYQHKDENVRCSIVDIRKPLNWKYIAISPHINQNYLLISTIDNSFYLILCTILLLILVLVFVMLLKNKANKKLQNLSLVDQVTGIENWTSFKINCEKNFKKFPSDEYVLITFDIDSFKVFNDLYGHQAGNETLKYIASVLNNSIFLGERCARYASDTFLILLKYKSDIEVINRIKLLQKSIQPRIHGYSMSFSFGIYIITDKTLSLDMMCDRCNLARNTIKGSHEKFYSFYNEETRQQIIQAKSIENDMENALKNNEFTAYFQPKNSVENEKIVGCEALVRWQHPTKGLIQPSAFIPIFEHNGFIVHIDLFVLGESCKLIQHWISHGITPIPISVNMSRVHLKDPNFVSYVVKLVNSYNIDTKYIEIELTESAIIENANILVNIMAKFKEHGFKISMDDFGSGYSSLNMLNELQVDVLKIDRMFFNKSSDSMRGKHIIESVIDMAKKLNIQTVSEGVETQDQLVFLKASGCDIAQGYFFSPPLSINEFLEYFKSHS